MYTPLPRILTIKESPIHGLGIFTKHRIFGGHILGVTHILDFEFHDNLIRTPLGGFINHADEPNCILFREGRKLFIKTKTVIQEGDEITLCYGKTKQLMSLP
jgi:hypothetical protein